MEYDPRPDNLIHEAVEEAVKANPQLILEPYYQMKAAARILALRLIALDPPPCQGCAQKVDHYCWDRGGQFWAGEASS